MPHRCYPTTNVYQNVYGTEVYLTVANARLASLRVRAPSLVPWTDIASVVLLLLLSVPTLLWFSRQWQIPPDGSRYLLQAWNLFSGHGYTVFDGYIIPGQAEYTVRGPVFPGIIALLMLPLGQDVSHLALGVRLLSLANPILIYLLVKRTGSTAVGGLVAAVSFTVLSYSARMTAAFNIDNVLLTVYLLSVLTLLLAAQKNDDLLSTLSGLLLGAAILTKETAFTALPLAAIAALIFGWRVRCLVLHYLAVVVVCLPWWIWVWSITGQLYLLGRVPPQLILPTLCSAFAVSVIAIALVWQRIPQRLWCNEQRRKWISLLVMALWTTALSFLLVRTSGHSLPDILKMASRKFLSHPTPGDIAVWLPVLSGIGFLSWKVLRGHRGWIFYATLLVTQMPVSLLVLAEGYDLARQWMIPQALLFGPLAGLLANLRRSAANKKQGLRRVSAGVASILLIVSLSTQAVAQAQAVLRSNYVGPNRGELRPQVLEMNEWMAGNVPSGEGILASSVWSEQLAFQDAGRHRWASLKLDCLRGENDMAARECEPTRAIAQTPPQPTAWFEMKPGCTAAALSMSDLMRQMEQSNSRYLLVSREPGYQSLRLLVPYAVSSGAFEIAHKEKPLTLLRMTEQPPRPVPTRMSKASFNMLTRCMQTKLGDDHKQAIRSVFPYGIKARGKMMSGVKGYRPSRELQVAVTQHDSADHINPAAQMSSGGVVLRP